jgi:hypothetical protein
MIDKMLILSIIDWHKINNEILQSINTYKENSAVDSFIVRTCKSSTASRRKNYGSCDMRIYEKPYFI